MLRETEFVQGYWRLLDWGFSTQQLVSFIEQHLSLGIDVVDHADIYGNYQCEKTFGEALKLAPHLKSQLKIVTKCNIVLNSGTQSAGVKHYNSSAQYIRESVEQSLTNLAIERIDMLLLHRLDYLMNPDEVADVFNTLIAEGKVAEFGVSNFSRDQFSLLKSRFAGLQTNQLEVNPISMEALENGTLDQLLTENLRPMAWSPLAGGQLFSSANTKHASLITVLKQLADELGAGVDQVLYAWIHRLPSRPIPIIGSGSIERVSAAVASKNITLSNEQWYRIWTAAKGHEVP